VAFAGRYRVAATVRGEDGAERDAECSPAEVAVGSDGGTFSIALR
jgi:hypothetical protein